MWWENRRRDKVAGNLEDKGIVDSADPQAVLEGFGDKTDKENLHFRYCL
jgi:hypothetical protein